MPHPRKPLLAPVLPFLLTVAALSMGLAACDDDEAGTETSGNDDDETGTETSGDDDGDDDDDDATGAETSGDDDQLKAVSFSSTIAPIIDTHCIGCHQLGGIAPFPLDSYEAAKSLGPLLVQSVESRRMPPWLPDPTCNEFSGSRRMGDEEVAAVRAWYDAGMPEGEPGVKLEAPPAEVFPATVRESIPGYSPDPALADDWRCFLMEMTFEQDTFITGSHVVPDQLPIVHHALVYAVPESAVEAIEKADAESPEAGYTCFGGPNPSTQGNTQGVDGEGGGGAGGGRGALAGFGGFPNQIGGWVPGSEPSLMPEGMGSLVAAGSRVVMQIHYNTLQTTPVPDRTTLEFRTTTEKPAQLAKTLPMVYLDLMIPAGESEVSFTTSLTNYGETTSRFREMTAHGHYLAQSFYVEKTGGEEAGEECVLSIPAWDFNWQQAYAPMPGKELTVAPGETLHLTCAYDNSAENQPFINGEQQEPRDVVWGESTLDEMCLLYLERVTDYTEAAATSGGAACAAVASTCAGVEANLSGIASCNATDTACLSCVLREAVTCGGIACLPKLQDPAVTACLTNCVLGGMLFDQPLQSCFAAECGDLYADLVDCIDPILANPTCQTALEACGL